MMKPRRIDHLLSRYGYCTRKEVPRWLREGRVTTIDGTAVRQAKDKINPLDLRIDAQPIEHPEGYLVLLHKPAGYVCSHTQQEGRRVFDLLPEQWIHRDPAPMSVGRLDKDTTGLLLLTDLGELVHRFTTPRSKTPKVYQVKVDRPLTDHLIEKFATGDLLLEEETKPCQPSTLSIHPNPQEATLTLYEGRYHQVKRMFSHFGYQVTQLHRSQFGDYHLENLPVGEYRVLPTLFTETSQ